MDHFLYRNGVLHAEDVAIPDIAASVGTPFYVYSAATLTRHYHLFTEALSPLPNMVCFAIKSLSNVAVLKLLGDLGAGMGVGWMGRWWWWWWWWWWCVCVCRWWLWWWW